MTMSDRIAVMNRGRYEQLGDPEMLYEHPQTRFVAGFLGVSNLLHGTVDGPADDYAVVRLRGGSVIRVPGALADVAPDIEVGVRPEKIRFFDDDREPPAGMNQLAGTIKDASYVGVSTQYIVEIPGGENVAVYEQNVERTERGSLHRPGELVRLAWSPDHTFVVRDPARVPVEA